MAYLDLERLEPDYVLVQTEEALLHLEKKGAGVWEKDAVSVRCVEGSWKLSSPRHLVRRVLVRWRAQLEMGAQVLGDHFERGYGDLEWKGLAAERILPWYFLVAEGDNTFGCGVCTNPNAICFWQVSDTDVSLCMDVRSLGRGVRLDNKELEMAQEVCHAVREALVELFGAEMADGIRVLYGGSAKPGNIAELVAKPDVDGALVGGASLKAADFSEMVVKAAE